MLLGRFLGIFFMGKIVKPQDLLAFNALVAIGLVIGVQLLTGLPALLCIVALGLCHSIMWAAIFLLAIDGLGAYTKRASSFLIMAIVGGALIPPLYGKLADLLNNDVKTSYLIMLPFYAVILYFGLQGYKVRSKNG
jgi:fucose permease